MEKRTKEQILKSNGFDFEAFNFQYVTSGKVLLLSMDEYAAQNSIHTNPIDTPRELSAGIPYTIGKFQCVLNEETGDLRIIVHTNKENLEIKPKSDNSIILHACRTKNNETINNFKEEIETIEIKVYDGAIPLEEKLNEQCESVCICCICGKETDYDFKNKLCPKCF